MTPPLRYVRFVDRDAVELTDIDGTVYELYRANVSNTWSVVWRTRPGGEREPTGSHEKRPTQEMVDAIIATERLSR